VNEADDIEKDAEGEAAPVDAAPADAAPAEAAAAPEPRRPESTLPEDAPRIHVATFDGPLDLLLYLIKRNEVDIHDIPIAPITRQYLDYLDLMRELNLDLAGEFMVMAATLIHIKSKVLLPIDPTDVPDEEQEDPREALVQRLLEFQRYKEAAGVLHQKGQIRAATWTRPETVVPRFDDAGEEMLEAGLFDLVSAFKELLERRKTLMAHEVGHEGKSLDEAMQELMALVPEGGSLDFIELFAAQRTRSDMVAAFLALLELVRLKRIKVYQRGVFGSIRVFRPVGPDTAPAPVNEA